MLDEPQSRYPHPSMDDEHEKISKSSGISLLGDLLISILSGGYSIIKKVISFLIQTLFGILSVLDLTRDMMLSILYYLRLNSNNRRLVNLILKNKQFYSTKKNQIFIFNQSLSIHIQEKVNNQNSLNLEHSQYMMDYEQSLNNKNFMHYHVDHILTFILKLNYGYIQSHYRYDIQITSDLPYKEFKSNVLKADHILKNL